jgi:hypothetical protein
MVGLEKAESTNFGSKAESCIPNYQYSPKRKDEEQ